MFKKLFILFSFAILFFSNVFFVSPASAQEEVNLYFFWGNGCPHCFKEEELLEQFKNKYPYLRVYSYEVYGDFKNMILLQKIATKLDARVDGIPFTIIGDKYFSGFSEVSSPADLADRITECKNKVCPDSVAEIVGLKTTTEVELPINNLPKEEKIIKIPFLGEINAVNFSLPFLTVIIGVLDGFNPCAMWILVFLISLLLGMKDRKRMWILGSAFILASSAVYFMFMAAWLNLVLFLGFVFWVRILIAVLALYGGIHNLKEFFTEKEAVCKVTGTEKRQKVFARLKEIVYENSFWLALSGIIILAGVVNLVEILCSAGLPAIYTQILVLNNLPKWQYYLYILGYIFFYMIDDLIIFFIAMTTLQLTGITTKYVRVAKLVGGLLMFIIGILLIFKPEWLMFG
ncbi:MAG: hypothetical protein Q7J14_01700 [Candidatus Magasanikbacteria bacterium]|nr:hypothetical protein [Candidatus Magasanikbacteria bacterium]